MKFEKMVLQDLALFFDEMSDVHIVDSVEIEVIVDTQELRERQTKGDVLIAEANTLIYIRKSDIKPKNVGQNLIFDNRVKTIEQWNEYDGIYEIVLSDNGGGLL